MKTLSAVLTAMVLMAASHAQADNATVTAAETYLNPYIKGFDPAKGKALLEKATAEGDINAEYQLAFLYDGKTLTLAQGAAIGVPDKAKALSLYEKAADQGLSEAVTSACSAHFHGPDTADNWNKTVVYCQKSMDNKDLVGFAAMGEAYAGGKGGLDVDGELAVTYLTAAADAHEPRATELLGHIYFDGKLTPQDYVKSAQRFRDALTQGSSANYLAQQYEKGLGLPAEPLEAERLYYYSAQNGDTASAAWIAAHPEVTAEHLKANSLNPLMMPPGVFTHTSTLPDGTTQTVEAMVGFWQRFMELYPVNALDNAVEGSVEMDCHWTTSGWVDDCFVVKEAPVGYGFARATLKGIQRPIKVDQQDKWNATFAGKSWHFIMKWQLH